MVPRAATPRIAPPAASELAAWVREARTRTIELVGDLDDEQLLGRRLTIVNPLLWEIGHIAWFQEKWVLRETLGRPPLRTDADALWDSIAIPHDVRWDLPLPSRAETLKYIEEVAERVATVLEGGAAEERVLYHARYSVHHEDMHTEAFTYTRQTLSYPAPRLGAVERPAAGGPERGAREVGAVASGTGALAGDAEVPAGELLLGGDPAEPFVFDNEKWAHPVRLERFHIARAAVSQSEFAAFVDDGGYARPELWDDDGWRWRQQAGAEHPVYWRRGDGVWLRRDFDTWVDLEPHRAVIHVNWHEANAYCRWAGRRLPSEAEWEAAALSEPTGAGAGLAGRKRRFPWGDGPPSAHTANLDWRGDGCLDVGALPAGASAFGCRQMIGNAWEWTASTFAPFPGFEPDPYREYSEPWFHTRRVLKGGAWATRARMLRGTWRNFYTPDRRDVLAGFRTCALE